MTAHLITAIEGGIAHVTFNRPDVRNAISSDMLDAMIAFLSRIEHDPEVRCVVMSGAGGSFMAGGDVKNFAESIDLPAADRRTAFETRVYRNNVVFSLLERLSVPVIASVAGHAAGAGLGFVAAADLAIAAESAKFTLAHVHIGVCPDAGTSYHLPRSVGLKRAKEIAMLGGALDATTAAAIGLINRVVTDDRLDAETEVLARRLAAGPTVALAEAKALLNGADGRGLAGQLAEEAAAVGRCAATDDFVEGVGAFMRRAKATFRGR